MCLGEGGIASSTWAAQFKNFVLCWTCFRRGRTIAKAITLICRRWQHCVFHVRRLPPAALHSGWWATLRRSCVNPDIVAPEPENRTTKATEHNQHRLDRHNHHQDDHQDRTTKTTKAASTPKTCFICFFVSHRGICGRRRGQRLSGLHVMFSFFCVTVRDREDIWCCTWLRQQQPCTKRPGCGRKGVILCTALFTGMALVDGAGSFLRCTFALDQSFCGGVERPGLSNLVIARPAGFSLCTTAIL